MDQKEFEQKLSEICDWRRADPSELTLNKKYLNERSDNPNGTIEIVRIYPVGQCADCHREKQTNHSRLFYRSFQRVKTGTWSERCEQCRRVRHTPTDPFGSNYIARGIRQAAPGKKLGRPKSKPPDK